jgi:threonine aldolase
MATFNRRALLQAAGAVTASRVARGAQTGAGDSGKRVYLTGDGLNLSPAEYAKLLMRLSTQEGFKPDVYLAGGAVEQLEQRFATLLGKEGALFLPTGTLANHLAVRLLAGDKRHVLVQEQSHLYRDESDCAQLLSGLNLVPLSPGQAAMTLDGVAKACEIAADPPYPVPVGAISIESPVRRRMGEVVDFEEMKKISAYAREKQIGLHLDGARMYVASPFTGVSPERYSELFDTVYVSLYKYFNAPFGAVLAGPKSLIQKAATLRRQFGSGLLHAWESAAVAGYYLEGFSERYQTAVRNGEALLRLLEGTGRFTVERVNPGSNVIGLRLTTGTADELQKRLAPAGIVIRGAKGSAQTWIQINETINRRPAEEIAKEFEKALG